MAADLLIIGIPGSGKSTLSGAVADGLRRLGRPHGLIETEWLAQADPPLEHEVVVEQLSALIAAMRAGGRTTLIVTATPESRIELDAVRHAIGDVTVLWLEAPLAEIERRLTAREPPEWSERLIGRGREIPRAELAAAADHVIDTGDTSEADALEQVLTIMSDLE